ncbi:MAG: T9SS type A sorting domain-containing protein [Calditrichae bacterium]|nr:T9SS type A sorting domain-containing protein [Calditrichia bacterium]
MTKKCTGFVRIIFACFVFYSLQLHASENILEKFSVKKVIMPDKAVSEKLLTPQSHSKLSQLTKGTQSEVTEYIGKTFEAIPFDEALGINSFNRKTAREYYNKELFSEPKNSASWYKATLDENGISVKTTYVQLVNDPRWDRILYSSMDSDIKSYNDIKHPGDMLVNAMGKVFVCEASENRIQVLQINENQDDISLIPVFSIKGLNVPVALAYHDNGTPLNDHDDFLYVADAAENTIIKFKLDDASAEKTAVYEGFEWPLSIACGRWDGVNNNLLYVIDHYSKRLTVARVSEAGLEIINQVAAQNSQTFSKVQTDYFGQVYLAETVNSSIFKYTAGLELLVSEKLPLNKALNDIIIPFGTIEIKGEGTYWTGFDQLFALQNWSDESGVNRYKLGLAATIKEIKLQGPDDFLSFSFRTTDFSNVRYRVIHNGNEIFQSAETWLSSADNEIQWNRKSDQGAQVPAGMYDVEVEYASAYGDEPLIEKQSFYLPLFYHINCGSEDATPAIKLIQGRAQHSDEKSWIEDPEEVVYSVTGLDPEAAYSLAAVIKENNSSREKSVFAVDGHILGELSSSVQPENNYKQLPAETFADGRIIITIRNIKGEKVAVSDILIKETGSSLNVFDSPEVLPAETQLSQNYPNPFNPETLIKYSLKKASEVELIVYDMLGREIAKLVSQFQQRGIYSVRFSGKNLSSGIYMYRLKAGGKIETRKMLLLR